MRHVLVLTVSALFLPGCWEAEEPGPESAADQQAEAGQAGDSTEEPAAPEEGGATTEAVEVDGALYAGTLQDPIPIDIDYLGAWQFEMKDDPFPEHVRAIDGKFVRIKGFMLPDVDFQHIKEWHLVRSLWGCCFGAPPRINEIVRISVDGEGMDYTYNTLEVVGRIEVVYEVEDGVVEDLYRIHATRIEELGFDDPEAPEDFDPSADFSTGFLPDSY